MKARIGRDSENTGGNGYRTRKERGQSVVWTAYLAAIVCCEWAAGYHLGSENQDQNKRRAFIAEEASAMSTLFREAADRLEAWGRRGGDS